MKKVIIIGKRKCCVSAYSENYLWQSSCPVYVDDKSDSVTFEWDDTLKAPDGTLLEHLCPRPVDRIMDTITEIIIVDDQDGLKKRITDMKSGETLRYDCNTGEFGCDFCPDVPYDTEKWKVVINGTDVVTAIRKIREAAENEILMAACLGYKFISIDTIKDDVEEDIRLTADEVLSDKWNVLELTDDIKKAEEKYRTIYLRNILKKTNFLDIDDDVIDEMSIDDMWDKMFNHEFNTEKKFKILKKILIK